jgi:type III secretion protein L
MSYFLVPDGTLALDSPLVKAQDRTAFADALSLLNAAKAAARGVEASVAEQRQQGYEAGLAQGLADAETMLAQEIASFAESTARYRRELDARVAEAAFAATTAVIGTFGDADIVTAIVRQQLAKRDADEALTIHIAPLMLDPVLQALAGSPNITLVPDPNMEATGCRITAAEGRIVADLSLQLDTLRQRWGLAVRAGETE